MSPVLGERRKAESETETAPPVVEQENPQSVNEAVEIVGGVHDHLAHVHRCLSEAIAEGFKSIVDKIEHIVGKNPDEPTPPTEIPNA